MEEFSFEEALRYAAMAEAYAWYCRQQGIAEVLDPAGNVSDTELARQAEAWAWARKHWGGFVADTESPHTRFLIDLFHRGPDYCRAKYKGKTGGEG